MYLIAASVSTMFALLGTAVASEPRVVDNLHKLPLAFEKNRSQAAAAVDYLARGAGYSVSLSRGNSAS